MKTNKSKKESKKFDLEKMNVTKLKNLHLIVGGGNLEGDDPDTGTATSNRCDKKIKGVE